MGLSALVKAVSLAPGDAAWRAQLGNAYARAGGVYGIGGWFLFAPLRDDPGFRALLEKMGLD